MREPPPSVLRRFRVQSPRSCARAPLLAGSLDGISRGTVWSDRARTATPQCPPSIQGPVAAIVREPPPPVAALTLRRAPPSVRKEPPPLRGAPLFARGRGRATYRPWTSRRLARMRRVSRSHPSPVRVGQDVQVLLLRTQFAGRAQPSEMALRSEVQDARSRPDQRPEQCASTNRPRVYQQTARLPTDLRARPRWLGVARDDEQRSTRPHPGGS